MIGAPPEALTCSRAGCRATASVRIDWRNPRLHTDGRHKTWLACDEHADYLEGFLAARSFPLEVSPVDADADHAEADREAADRTPAESGAATGSP